MKTADSIFLKSLLLDSLRSDLPPVAKLDEVKQSVVADANVALELDIMRWEDDGGPCTSAPPASCDEPSNA
ncbi:MAG: hypothetical protein JWP89_3993 [Schlesneria sp.]|nr:hypothetical protein [Schlesneria sp.]